MRGRMLIIGLALAAVAIAFVASARRRPQAAGAGDRDRDAAGGPCPANALKLTLVYSPEKELAAGAADQALQRRAPRERRAHRRRRRQDRRLRRRRDPDRPGHAAPGAVVARVLLLGPAAQLRGRPPAGRRREPVDRAHAAGDRDVEAARRRLRLPEAQARLQGARRARHRRLGGGRQAAVRDVQVRAHQPGLLDLGPLRGRRLLLRGGRQEGRPDRGRRHPRAPAGAAARALDRALRRHDAVHRRRDAPARARLRLGRRDGGDDDDRLQPPRGRLATGSSPCTRRRARSSPTTR